MSLPTKPTQSLDDQPHEACGVIGIFAPNEDVARMAFFGLYALQHRGQEAAGIAVSDGQTARLHKDMGLVSQVFNPQNLAPLTGHYAIGHTRYSTTGSSVAAQRPAVPDRDPARPAGGGPQRQPGQRRRAAPHGAGARGRAVVVVRQRGHDHDAGRRGRRTVGKSASRARMPSVAGRLFADDPDARQRHRRARPVGLSPAERRPAAQRRARRRVGDRRAAHARLRGRARSQAGRDRHAEQHGAARAPGRAARTAAGPLHLRARLLLPPRQRLGRPQRAPGAPAPGRGAGARSAGRGRRRHPGARFVHAGRHRLHPRNRASPTTTALSRTATSGARSSSRPTRCASRAWRSSSTCWPRTCAASAW